MDPRNEELLRALDKNHAMLVVRVDHHDERISELLDEARWVRRLVISTLISVLVGVALAAFGVILAL